MRYLLFEHGPGKIGFFFMCIKMIAAQLCKGIYVCTCNFSFGCCDLVAHFQFIKIFSEWMHIRMYTPCIRLIALGNGSDGGWRSLNSDSLQIMFNASYSPHFFTSASSSRTTMDQHG